MKRRVFYSLKTFLVFSVLFSIFITLFVTENYIQVQSAKKLSESFKKQRDDLTKNIANAMINPLSIFSPSDASNSLEIIKKDDKIVHIEVYDSITEATFLNIYIPHRANGALLENFQEIYNKNNEKLGWVKIIFNDSEIQKQITEINSIIEEILVFTFIIIFIIMASLLYFKVFKPLEKLFMQAEDFQQNNFNSVYLYNGYDELNQVGESFEKARKAIQSLVQELAVKNKELEKLYVTDKLTGIFNRHKLDTILQKHENLAKRYNQIFGIIILDIDDFKFINDTYGHLQGDKVLQEFATILKKTIRKTDTLGRWGGEEFLIIVSQLDKNSLIEFVTKIRENIANHDFNLPKQITASFGASLYTDTIESLIKKADDALYEAKNSGKNKACFY